MNDEQLLKSLLTLIGRVKGNGDSMPDHTLAKIKDTLVKVTSYGDDEEEDPYGEGYSIVDDPDQEFEDDAAGQWLKEQEARTEEAETEEAETEEAETDEVQPAAESKVEAPQKTTSSGYTDWKPGEYTEEQKSGIDKLVSEGFSPREAERIVGAYKGPKDFQSALTHTVKPSQMSEKMLNILKPMAKDYLDRASKHEALSADPEKNPTKHAEGKMIQAFEQHHGDKQKAFKDFLASDAVKELKGRDRHRAIAQFHKDWAEQNPEHEQNVGKIAEAAQSFKQADEARKKSLQERLDHIMGMGQQDESYSAAEGSQHAGGVRTEEGTQATMIKDPAAKFAESHGKKFSNPEFVNKLRGIASPEQMERWQRVSSAKKMKTPSGTEGGGQQ